jgi:16S rRNA (adenine1518-N6/adenine1519-N6)-dimethyltransferase
VSEDGLPPLRDVIARHDLAAKRSLGQHFLLDLNLTGRIARAAGPLRGVVVYEVGPGPGGLTRALLIEDAERVVAVEADPRVLPALQEIAAAYPGRLDIVQGDALQFDPARIGADRLRIVANLPYNVATPLLTGWLTADAWPPAWDRAVLMFQKEVADRLVAEPRSKAYGRLAVLTQWRCAAQRLFDIDPRAFTPPPKVISTVIALSPRESPLPCRTAALERVTAAAFGQRRKMLRASLRSLDRPPDRLLEEADILGTRRAEELSVEEFVRLARVYDALTPER